MVKKLEIQLVLLLFVGTVYSSDFLVPEVRLEAFTPKGFKASIADQPGIQLFAFHGNLNKHISRVDPGEYSEDLTSVSADGRWTYFNKDLVLRRDDEINFWIFIQHDKSGYRRDSQKWVVTDLVELSDEKCVPSATVVSGQSLICKGSVVFEDHFSRDQIDDGKWLVEEYIGTNAAEDFEFLSYQKRICQIKRGNLVIKPIFAKTLKEVEGELDLRNTCTRELAEECQAKAENVFILPPVTSGQITSKMSFRYGKIEIKAKLPSGDWLYPQMYLQQVNDKNKKIWIGYVRGNNQLVGSNGKDIGNTLLYGGPVVDFTSSDRDYYLKTYRSTTGSIAGLKHTFTVIWTKDSIKLLLNGVEYGAISQEVMSDLKFSESDMVRIVLGVGVGGVNDFPDDFESGTNPKPWKNRGRTQLLDFFEAQTKWSKTWGDQSALQVESVKVTAL